MSGTIEELMSIKEEAIKSIPTLSDLELYLFNDFLIDLLNYISKESSYRLKEANKDFLELSKINDSKLSEEK